MNYFVSLGQIAKLLNAELHGAEDIQIYGISALQDAQEGQLSFLSNSRYKKHLSETSASAVLLTKADAEFFDGNVIIVEDPYLAFAKISHLFDKKPKSSAGIHPKAVIAADVFIDASCSIGPNVVIEAGAVIGSRVVIGANTFVGSRTVISEDAWIAPNVTIYHDIKIGKRIIIQAGAVIGGEGFGFANHKGEWIKIAQVGGVLIGDDVEIGANTTIDRGALTDTIIGNGVKLDNQIMIAHNVQIGDNTAMAACCGISGSTKIGRNCMIAGGVGMVGHIEVCDNVFVTGMTMVTRSIKEPGAYSSGTAMQPANEWKKSVARLRHLDDMAKRFQLVEKKLEDLLSEKN